MPFYDRVRVAIPTKGTGAVVLGNAALGYKSLSQAGVPVGEVVSYVIEDLVGAFEAGTGKILQTGLFERTAVTSSSNANGPINLSGLASLFLSPLAVNLVGLGADGRISPNALTGTKGYANVKQAVLGPGEFPPASDGGNGSTGPLAPYQASTDATLEQQISQETIVGNHRKPMNRTVTKTRGVTPSDFGAGTRLRSGDGIDTIFWQGSSGAGQSAHVALFNVYVDGTPRDGANGEFPGQLTWDTGTGRQQSLTPEYFGSQTALAMNFRQQVFFPGETFARQVIAGTNTLFAFGGDFGGVVRVGPGGADPGMAPIAYDGGHSTLLTVPEPYRVEYDQRYIYNTPGDGIRRRVETKDGRSCTAAPLSDLGAGGTVTIEPGLQGFGCGYVTIRTGGSPSNQFAGVAQITYPVAFPTNSNVMLQAVTAPSAAMAPFVQCSANGFTIFLSGTLDANKAYRFMFTWRGW